MNLINQKLYNTLVLNLILRPISKLSEKHMFSSSSLPVLLPIYPNSKYWYKYYFFVGEISKTWMRKLYEYPLYTDGKEDMNR